MRSVYQTSAPSPHPTFPEAKHPSTPSARPRSHQPVMATQASAVIRAARPSLRNAHDKVAYAVHATVMTRGWSLIATGAAADAEPPRGASK
jgi:hypothetical protein